MKSKKKLIVAVAIVVVALIALFLITRPAAVNAGEDPNLSPEEHAALVEKGRYLAIAGDCAACHTVHGEVEYSGGRGLITPFGTIYAPNLTPDDETGIGKWTRTDFRRAMHHGQGLGGRNLYPAFSYPYFARVTAEDTDAIYAYLMSLEPVSNPPTPNEMGFPFNIRLMLKGWNLLHFRGGEFEPDPNQSAEWNRGAYLVEGLGHCAACHTPKNMIGGDRKSQYMRGGVLEGWYASDLTGDPLTGLGNWTEDDIVEYLQTGVNQYSSAYGTMAEVVTMSTSQMTAEDLMAMAVYLKSLPAPAPRNPSPAPDAETMARGEAVYVQACQDCHLADGTGAPYAFPALAGNANVHALNPSSLIHITLVGSNPPDNPSPAGLEMTPFPELTDQQIADVATYIRNAWGNNAPAVNVRDVAHLREELGPRIGEAAERKAAAAAAAAAAEAAALEAAAEAGELVPAE